MTLIAPALLFAFALLVGSFAVLVRDFLEERTRGWLRVLLVVVLAPSCALAAALATVVLTSALLTALVPDESPAGPSEPPARIEPTEPEATSESTEPETDHRRDADYLTLGDALTLGDSLALGLPLTLARGMKATSVTVRGSLGPSLSPLVTQRLGRKVLGNASDSLVMLAVLRLGHPLPGGV